jgi:uncharacterized repeat protein (TIGR01451 family)
MKRLLTTLALAALPAVAGAASKVSLASDVYVERIEQDADGRAKTVLTPPREVSAGDRLVFVLSFRNGGSEAASGFVITNPVPDSVSFAEADGAEVSVDGGRTWGPLAALTVAGADRRARPAAASDVTHVRWRVQEAIGAGQTGQLSYRAIAR